MSSKPPVPLQDILLSEADAKDPRALANKLNVSFTNIIQKINELIGAQGAKITMTGPLDMAGNPIINVGHDPDNARTVITKKVADSLYSASALAPQLAPTAKSPLPGYRQVSNPYQQEGNTSHLNSLANTAPTGNSSTVTFGVASGGFVPVTISGGLFTRADGSQIAYPAFNDSLPLATSYAIATLSRTGGLVSGSTTGANTLTPAEGVTVIITSGQSSFNGQFILETAATPNFTYFQDGPNQSATTGSPPVLTASINLLGVYYYTIKPKLGSVFRYPVAFANDSNQNRINACKDGSQIIAVVTVDGTGGVDASTAGGGTNPVTNIGGVNVLITV